MTTRWKCNRWIFPLMAACGLVLYITVFLVPRLNIIDASGISSRASNLDQGIRETDRHFLDDLLRKNNQDDRGAGISLLSPDPNAVKAGAIADNPKATPKTSKRYREFETLRGHR